MAFCIAFAIMVFVATLAICQPFEKNLVPETPGTCGNRNAFWLCVGIFNIWTDLSVISLPVPMIWRFKVSTTQKWHLTLLFNLGFFVTRLTCLLNVDFTGDLTYSVTNTNIWSLLEPTLAVIVGNLLTMGPLAQRAKVAIFGQSERSAARYYAKSHPTNTFHDRDRSQFHKLDSDSTQLVGTETIIKPGPGGGMEGSSHTDHEFGEGNYDGNLDRIHVTTEIELQSPRIGEGF